MEIWKVFLTENLENLKFSIFSVFENRSSFLNSRFSQNFQISGSPFLCAGHQKTLSSKMMILGKQSDRFCCAESAVVSCSAEPPQSLGAHFLDGPREFVRTSHRTAINQNLYAKCSDPDTNNKTSSASSGFYTFFLFFHNLFLGLFFF